MPRTQNSLNANSAPKMCRWCLSDNVVLRAHAVVAPWIVGTGVHSENRTALFECLNCHFHFFSKDFSPIELSAIYEDYRGESYYARRHKWEPWYSRSVNDAIGHNEALIQHRRRHLEDLVRNYQATFARPPLKIVVDFGGDEGQFIPQIPTIEKRFVFEVSNSPTVEGVERVGSWDEVQRLNPDLIMLCHVLEHTFEARSILQWAFNSLPANSMVYVEVPLDRPPRISRVMGRAWYRKYVSVLSWARWPWIAADFMSLVTRRYLTRCAAGTVLKQSEHVQFFDPECLTQVMKDIGFVDLIESTYSPSVGISRLQTEAVGVLARKPAVG